MKEVDEVSGEGDAILVPLPVTIVPVLPLETLGEVKPLDETVLKLPLSPSAYDFDARILLTTMSLNSAFASPS